MTKLRNPMLGFEAHGSLGDALTFQGRPGTSYVRKKPHPIQPNSLAQMYHRWLYQDYCYLWSSLSVADKQAWIALARGTRLSGFQFYMRTKLNTLPELVAIFHLDHQSGGTTPDSSPGNNPASVTGAITSPGIIHNSFYFDGVNDHLRVPHIERYNFTSQVTIELFVKPYFNVVKPAGVIVRHWPGYGFDVQTASTPFPNCLIRTNPSGNFIQTSATALTYDVWQHLCMTFDGDRLRCFQKGVKTDDWDAPNEPLQTGTTDLFIATSNGLSDWALSYYDHLFIWNIALPPELIKVHSERRWPLQ